MKTPDLYDRALRWLGRREYGETELRRRLMQQEGATPDLVDQVIHRLLELNYLNDQRFAELVVRERIRRGQGPVRIRHELRQKGVPNSLIEQALQSQQSEADDLVTQAQKALNKRYGDAPAEDWKARKKRYDFLMRRGFDGETVRKALDDA
uniref:Regulatory protein RecX n=1 Tax=Magnetococcus massalia (strain MO-1) TaxID=451514 RepID=A0A1S7LNE6_MAGMO|nr:Regulatory protein recX. Regular protein for recA [Candidatus Magnetococcus massalia]